MNGMGRLAEQAGKPTSQKRDVGHPLLRSRGMRRERENETWATRPTKQEAKPSSKR